MKFMIIVTALFLAVTLASTGRGIGQTSAKSPADKETAAKAAIVAYAANVSAFPHYKCRYRITKGHAKSVEDALKGNWINAGWYDCRLILDDQKELFEGFAPPPDPNQAREVAGKKGGSLVPSPGPANRYLSDGKRDMNYEPLLKTVNLFSIDKIRRGPGSHTPFDMFFVGWHNRAGPDVLLKQAAEYDFSVVGFEEVLGRPVITVRFDQRKQAEAPKRFEAISKTFAFDRGRGHLPIRMQLFVRSNLYTTVFVTQVRECTNKRWFPERTVEISKDGDVYAVREMLLLELDADQRPKHEEFSFTIPAGTSVVEFGGDMKKFFRLKQDEKITVDDIPTLFKMLERAKANPLMNTALSEHRPSGWDRWVLGAVGLTVTLGGALVLVRRRMGARRPTT